MWVDFIIKVFYNHYHFFCRVLKAPGGGCSRESVFSDTSSSTCSMASSPNESRASSASPKTPAKKYHMKSNFELGDEQPMHPIDSPTRRPYKPSGKNNFIDSIDLE